MLNKEVNSCDEYWVVGTVRPKSVEHVNGVGVVREDDNLSG